MNFQSGVTETQQARIFPRTQAFFITFWIMCISKGDCNQPLPTRSVFEDQIKMFEFIELRIL